MTPEDYLKMVCYLLAEISDNLFLLNILIGTALVFFALYVVVPAVRRALWPRLWRRDSAREWRRVPAIVERETPRSMR